MTITEFLHYLDAHRIDIWIEDTKLLIGMNSNVNIPVMKEDKKALKVRLLNNQFASQRGWIVGNFGDMYSYQYSSSWYIFVERNLNETVDVYRYKFNLDNQVHQVKGLYEGLSFSEAYLKVKSFLNWFYTENPDLKKGTY